MTLNDVKYLKAEFTRSDVEETLIGLGKSINNYLSNSLSEFLSLEDFFGTFCEGNKELSPTYFFVQTRLKKGRVGIGYEFKSVEDIAGELRVSVYDNGENVLQNQVDEVYAVLRQIVNQKGLKILDEGVRKEY